MRASQPPSNAPETALVPPGWPPAEGSGPGRRVALRRADIAAALVAIAAVGYTVFALVQGPPGTSHRPPAAASSAPAASPSGSGTRAASPTEPTASDSPHGAPGAGVATAGPGAGTRPGRVASPGAGTAADARHGVTVTHGTDGGLTRATRSTTTSAPTRTTAASAASTAPRTSTGATRIPSQQNAPATSGAVVPAGTLTSGAAIALRATTACCTGRYIRHQSDRGVTSVITSSSPSQDRSDATWIVRPGLANSSCVSFESRNYPGDYLRHSNFQLYLQPMDGTALFRADATFCPTAGRSGTGTSFASYNYPTKFLRHYYNMLYIASDGGGYAWDNPNYWVDDVTWVVTSPWAP